MGGVAPMQQEQHQGLLDGRQGGKPVALPDVARVADVVAVVVDRWRKMKKVYIWAQQWEYFIQFPIDLPRGNINNQL